MDEKTKILICLGAATAANCVPCFEHHFQKADAAGLTTEEIREAVDLASQVKKGAHMAIRNTISGIMSQKPPYDLPCSGPSNRACCD
jgi:AhpD family alkylhydroperoxidase